MGMIDENERIRLRWQAKDFILGAGSPVTESQITNNLGTNNHMTNRIINEFKDAGLVEPFPLGKDTKNPIMAWKMMPELKTIKKKELSKSLEIKKPRKDKRDYRTK